VVENGRVAVLGVFRCGLTKAFNQMAGGWVGQTAERSFSIHDDAAKQWNITKLSDEQTSLRKMRGIRPDASRLCSQLDKLTLLFYNYLVMSLEDMCD